MPAEITMPQLSDTMSEGTLLKWHKKEGEKVEEGEVIAEVETDKANMDMEAFEAGTIAVLDVKEGEKVKVGERIALLATAGEDVEQVKKQAAGKGKKAEGSAAGAGGRRSAAKEQVQRAGVGAASETAEEAEAPVAGVSSHETEAGREPIEAGRARSRRELVGDGPERTSEQMSRDAVATVQRRRPEGPNGKAERLKASPLARRIAQEKGIDLAQIEGTGPGGRIVQKDVLAAVEAPPPKEKPGREAAQPARIGRGETQEIELNKIRQTIALRMQQSKQQLPHFYETIDIDMEALSALRGRINKQLEKQDIRLSISDLINKAIAAALVQHPALNAHFDAKGNRVIRYGDVHLGIAVALPDGLIVPVLRSIDQMGLVEIRQRSVDLAERARAGRLKRDELSGATFTVSTLGQWGIREFSAIINPPEVAILAVGAAEKRPVVRDDQVVPRTMMTVTLSVDHRGVDGATAAEFLRTLKAFLEEPGMMLV